MIVAFVVLVVGSVFAQSDLVSQTESVAEAVQGQNQPKSEPSSEIERFESEIREIFRSDFADALMLHLTKKPIPASYKSCAEAVKECQIENSLGRVPIYQQEFMECQAKNDHLHSLAQSFHALTAKLDKKYDTVADLCIVASQSTLKVVRKRLYDLDQSQCINLFKQVMDYGGQVKGSRLCVLSNKLYKDNKNVSYDKQILKCRQLLKKMNSLASQI